MGLKVTDCSFTDCAGGILAPDSLEIELTGTQFIRGGQAIDLYKTPTLQSLGLPLNTPPEQLHELISELINNRSSTPEQKTEIVRGSKLGQLLSGLSTFSTIAKNIVELANKFT